MALKWRSNGVQMGFKWGSNGFQMALTAVRLKWRWNGVEMGLKWRWNGVEMGRTTTCATIDVISDIPKSEAPFPLCRQHPFAS
jgi:hypothetical protein